MGIHISARVAWHDDGWNGRICKNPSANTFCVGPHSFPGQSIAENRDLTWEGGCAGQRTGDLSQLPPCCYSINAFGDSDSAAEADPPDWFKDGTSTLRWKLPPATVCVWPYEEMYGDEVKKGGRFDYDKRLENARSFFDTVRPDKSLIFYYANYSNPFTEEEAKRYVLVGISRVRELGDELFYEGCSQKVKERYGGGFVWMRSITSHYPDEGFVIPYHRYRDQPEVLQRLALFPENPRLCKYATRQFEDDDALGLVEGFLGVVRELQAVGDTSQNWDERVRWLERLVSELWAHRGLLPGMTSVLEVLRFEQCIDYFKERALVGDEVSTHSAIFLLLNGRSNELPGVALSPRELKGIRRQWKLRTVEEQRLLRDILPRFAVTAGQIAKILNDKRAQNGIASDLAQLAENPYLLTEQYVGDDADDSIAWGKIDRGMIPSPELGAESWAATDDERRFRSLMVDVLRRQDSHVFLSAETVIDAANRRLSFLPEWKRFTFNDRYLNADADFIDEAVVTRSEKAATYLYQRQVFDEERLLEEKLKFMIGGPDITLRAPVTRAIWDGYLHDTGSPLARKSADQYRAAIDGQIDACERVFVRPFAVLAGEAGTGKTTVIRAIIKAIKRGHGTGASVIALAPTGKAADRIREVIEGDSGLEGKVEVGTIHSFLAKRGWLNPNMSFRRNGGQVEETYQTYILDEASMLEQSLMATLFRAIRWPTVQRLILVGDPNQLPPIGRGRILADIIAYLHANVPESVATLKDNLRQLRGQVTDQGTGIIELAQSYAQASVGQRQASANSSSSEGGADDGEADGEARLRNAQAEDILARVQMGGEIAPDLSVVYWEDQEDLHQKLFAQMTAAFSADLPGSAEEAEGEQELNALWWNAHEKNSQPAYFQILSPYRGEFFGTDELNRVCQANLRSYRPDGTNAINGVMLYDKVIQFRNRTRSSPIWAWNHNKGQMEAVEIFNGQIGFVWPHLFDRKKWKHPNFRLEKFRVAFERRENLSVGYGKRLGQDADGRWIPEEKVEENLELAYAISVHKAQGSEFDRVFIVVPSSKQSMLSTELFYTALTRARRHCTLLVEKDISPLLGMRRLESSRLRRINSSLFEFRAVPETLVRLNGWFAEGRIHQSLADIVVRSKSEVIIANMLFEREIPFRYEQPLYAKDGTFYLPDFTVSWRGTDYYWEHVGMLHRDDYRAHWEKKKKWYDRFFPGRLLTTEEGPDLSVRAAEVIAGNFK